MYDNIYTKYENAKIFINHATAEDVIKMLEKEKRLTAEQCAYLSKAYIFANDDKKALKYAKKSVKLESEYSYGYVRLAFVLGRLGKKKECLKNIILAEKFGADNWLIQTFIGSLYKYAGEEEKAEYYLNLLEENPLDTAEYYMNVGFMYAMLDTVEGNEKSLEYYKKAEEYDYKDRYLTYSRIMDAYADLLESEKTYEYLEKCLAIKETYDLIEKRIQYFIYIERYDEADEFSREYYRQGHDKQQALIFLAYSAKKQKRFNKALRYLRFADYTTDADEYLYELMAETYEAKDDYYSAIDFYKKALKFNEFNDDVFLNLSYCYSQIKDYELADKYADAAIELNDKSAYSYYRKGNIMVSVKRYDEAANAFKKAVELDPEDVDYYNSLSYCYSKDEKLDLSLEYANRALLLDKTNAYSYFRKAWALQEMVKYKESIAAYEKCIECDSGYVDAYANISYCYSKLEEFKKSILYANKAIMVNKDYAYSHYRKAWALHNLGKYNEAIDDYIQAIELDPVDVFNYIGIAGVYLDKQENLSALEFANKAILLDRSCANAYYFKSVALSNLGKKTEAEKVYAKARQLGFDGL